jgi:hypothetical protein
MAQVIFALYLYHVAPKEKRICFSQFFESANKLYDLYDRRVIIPNKRSRNYTKDKKNKLGNENCAVERATINDKKKFC